MENAEIAERRKTAIARGVGMMTQVYVERAENAEVRDVEGCRYIDFAVGIAVVKTGHRHPRVMAAVQKKLDSFTRLASGRPSGRTPPCQAISKSAPSLSPPAPGRWRTR